jgi:hypothetical protein
MTHNQPTYKIEKGIEISRRGNARIYPFDQLEPGDSFFVPGAAHAKLSGPTNYARKRWPDRKFAVRSVDGGIRVWRVK